MKNAFEEKLEKSLFRLNTYTGVYMFITFNVENLVFSGEPKEGFENSSFYSNYFIFGYFKIYDFRKHENDNYKHVSYNHINVFDVTN